MTNEDRLKVVLNLLDEVARVIWATSDELYRRGEGRSVVGVVRFCVAAQDESPLIEREALTEAAVVALAADPGVPMSDGDAWTDVENHSHGLAREAAAMWVKRVSGSLWVAVRVLDVLANPV